ncbi:MAG: FkbM family methyltransferase [Flavobacteriaceae bacterium]
MIKNILIEDKLTHHLEELRVFCENSHIILYGAGLTGAGIITKLKSLNVNPLSIVDDTPAKQGKDLLGVPIIPSNDLKNVEGDFAIIVTMINPSMDFFSFKENLKKNGYKNVFSFLELNQLYPDTFLPFMHFDVREYFIGEQPRIEEALSLFKEEKSRDIFLNNLKFRLNMDFENLSKGDHQDYFPDDVIKIKENSVFVDCGAFDGDTLHSFISKNPSFSKAFAFEPDPINFAKLLSYCADLPSETSSRTYVYNAGLSDKHGFLKFSSLNNMASSLDSDGDSIIQTLSLDEFCYPILKDFEDEILIKMDIEGEEPNAIKACEDLIKNKISHLAISIYHNPNDLWHIPLMIKEIDSNYNFLLRQHGNDSMDLVLYAIKKDDN